MQAAGGPITPLIFLAAMLMTLPTAISYALLNREAPSAGAAAAWLSAAINPHAGFQAGLLMTTYFAMATVGAPLVFVLFFQDLLVLLHANLPRHVIWALGLLLSSAPVAWVCLRGAEVSVRNTIRLMILETLVVVALSATILVAKAHVPGGINLLPFDLNRTTSLSGFWSAMILGIVAFCGFDIVSTAAEEARAPREYLPKAILLTVIGMAIFWAGNAWVFTLSTPPDQVAMYNAEGLTAITPVAQAYWGRWGHLLVIATAFTGITAVNISSMQGTSRIVFALSREGLLPRGLSHLIGEKRVPKNVIWCVLIAVLVLDEGTLYALGNIVDSFTWWSNALVFFAALTFLAVNIANALYFWRRARERFTILRNVLVPALGIAMNSYLIYAAFFLALWSGSWRTGKSVVVTCTALLALEIAVVIYMRLSRPALFFGKPRWS